MSRQPHTSNDGSRFRARAVVFEQPEAMALRSIELPPPATGQVVVDVEWSGISTGTEKLLWTGRMPPFPGMGYPLVPGYETIGRIASCGSDATVRPGERVFVSGARCYGEIHGLFGGASSCVVVDEAKTLPVGERLAEDGVLLALAATAHHALMLDGEPALPDEIIGHGVLGRLLARLAIALGGAPPVVRETLERRMDGAAGYPVLHPDDDDEVATSLRSSRRRGSNDRKRCRRIIDASGDPAILDKLVARLDRHGEIVLAGFYAEPLSFSFPPAFMREARFRIAAEWQPDDLGAVLRLIDDRKLDLGGLISHRVPASDAGDAYPVAFTDPDCLKMILDWRSL